MSRTIASFFAVTAETPHSNPASTDDVEDDMRLVHYSVLGPVFTILLAPAASPALAQTSEDSSTRASLMEQARDALASESVAPQRSAIERGLYWYDNQYVLGEDCLAAGRASISRGATSRPAPVSSSASATTRR